MSAARTLVLALLLSSCAAPTTTPPAENGVRHWGAMREVLRDGRTEGRIPLAEVVGPHTVAVGALEGLAAEITVDAGHIHLAEVVESGAPDGLRVRSPRPGELATLLVTAEVPAWVTSPLPGVDDLASLERVVREHARERDLDVAEPFPFRVEGRAAVLRLHVLDHSCPIADPEGPAPWRFEGAFESVVLIGFHAADAAGTLTHHGQQSHVHVLLPGKDICGHLDQVRLEPGATLFLPRFTSP